MGYCPENIVSGVITFKKNDNIFKLQGYLITTKFIAALVVESICKDIYVAK